MDSPINLGQADGDGLVVRISSRTADYKFPLTLERGVGGSRACAFVCAECALSVRTHIFHGKKRALSRLALAHALHVRG